MHLPLSILFRSTAFSAAFGCLLVGPLAAQTVSADPVEAAFYACNGQPVTVEDRLAALIAAGWGIAGSSPALDALFAQIYASGVKGFFITGEPSLKKAALSGQAVNPISALIGTVNGETAVATLQSGPITQLPQIVQFAADAAASGYLYLSAPNDSALLRMVLFAPENLSSGYSVHCDLYLQVPLTDAYIDSHMPAEVSPASLSRDHKTFDYTFYQVTYSTMAGYTGKVIYVDATQLASLKSHPAGAKGSAKPPSKLASIVKFESRNVLLIDTTSRPHEVTP